MDPDEPSSTGIIKQNNVLKSSNSLSYFGYTII